MNTIRKNNRAMSVMLALVLMAGLLVIPSKTEAAAKIKLSETSLTLTAKEKKTLKLKKGKKTIKKGIKWSSTKKKVAKVSSKGKITALKKGKTKIVAKYKGKKYICKLTVKKAAKGQTDPTVTPAPGTTETPSAEVTPAPGTSVTPSVTVTPGTTVTPSVTPAPGTTGTVTPQADPTTAPEATVTSAPEATATPTAAPTPTVVLKIESSKDEVAALDSIALTLKANGKKVTDGVKWTSEDKNIATVSSSGRVTGVKKGSVTITAEYKGVTADKEIKILDTAIKVKDSALKISNGGFGLISFTENGKDVTVESATFKSSNEKIVKVYPDGTVVGVDAGEATVTVSYAGKTSYVSVTVEKYTSNVSKIEGSLTPQMFGANPNDNDDDTEAFRKMFSAAASNTYTTILGWKHCQAIYIPSGKYKISGSVIDKNLKTKSGDPVRLCLFEVTGSGRESTVLDFSGEVLFDSRVDGSQAIFAFSTFKDIGFLGNDKNIFMTMQSTGGDSIQRLQFMSCAFDNLKTILFVEESTVMLSEVTFSYCKIVHCGSDSSRCQMFVLNDPQGVNWRFDYTDMESFIGDAFVFKTGQSITINGGSIIPSGSGSTVFNFSEVTNRHGMGSSNAPHVMATGARFEIYSGCTLVKTSNLSKDNPKLSFSRCNLGGNDERSDKWIVIENGCLDAVFDNCYRCGDLRFYITNTIDSYVYPKVKFINCSDINVNNLVNRSTVTAPTTSSHLNNNLHVIVDDQYDFYLINGGYAKTVTDLKQCRQVLHVSDADKSAITDGLTLSTKPYGYVDYVELTVTKNENAGNTPVKVTLYNGDTKISDTVTVDFADSKTYKIPVYDKDDCHYVDTLNVRFNTSKTVKVNYGVTVVKR